MAGNIEDSKARYRRVSISVQPTIQEEPTVNSTISALVNSNPLIEIEAPVASTENSSTRTRRRSSLSILHTLAVNHLLPTAGARRRNFLVGSGQQLSDDVMNDISSCFPNGRSLTIMVATWNTGEAKKLYEQNYTPTARQTAKPKERLLDDMSDILLPKFIDYVSDVLIICTQEMAVVKNNIDWETLLQEVIGPTHVLFHSLHFGTLSLCIFLRRDLVWYCSEPEEDIIKFRVMGPIRTKASLVITFNLFGTSFMIINSHFEAGDDSEGRLNRHLNFQNTTNKLKIPHEFIQRIALTNKHLNNGSKTDGLKRADSASSLKTPTKADLDITKSCDFVLWAGDMNYRIDMSHQEVLDHCEKSNYSDLLLKDEFRTAQNKTDHIFADFKEANIEFAPTYKFDLRAAEDKYTKHRTPSYTDRILYRDKPSGPMECTRYQSVEGVKHSDHKPVVAHFRIKLKPGSNTGNLSYGKFNHEVYKRGCEQRERHHSLGIGLKNDIKRRPAASTSSVCVLQ